MCIDVGNGGCGKSHVIHAMNTTFHGVGLKILFTSLTCLTANNISGRTIHSTVNLPFSGGYRVSKKPTKQIPIRIRTTICINETNGNGIENKIRI